jgi:hypothetical protein
MAGPLGALLVGLAVSTTEIGNGGFGSVHHRV